MYLDMDWSDHFRLWSIGDLDSLEHDILREKVRRNATAVWGSRSR